MKTTLVVHIPPGQGDNLTEVDWVVANREGQILHKGSLERGEAFIAPMPVDLERAIILLPAADLFVRRVKVPAKTEREARMAAPFVIEDYLASPLEETHVSVGEPIDEAGTRWVFAASKVLVTAWSEIIEGLGVKPVYVMPDAMALEGFGGDLTVVQVNDFALYQAPLADLLALDKRLLESPDEGESAAQEPEVPGPLCGGFELNLADMALPSLGAAIQPKRLLISEDINPALIVPGPEPVALKRIPTPNLSANAARLSNTVLNGLPRLFGKRFSAQVNWGELFKPWRVATGLLVATGLISLIIQTGEGFYYQARTEAYTAASTRAFQEAFPDVSRIQNLRVQVRQRTGGSGASGQAVFLNLATMLQEILVSVEDVTVQSLRFNGDTGELRVSALYSDFSDFERLREAAANYDLVLVDGGARQSSAGITGDFVVRAR